jgi:flagellum-specific ATP synthase
MLDNSIELLDAAKPIARFGKLTRASGMVLESGGLTLPVGSICQIQAAGDQEPIEAEVVGFANQKLMLMPCSPVTGLSPGAKVCVREPVVNLPGLNQPAHPNRRWTDYARQLPIGAGLLGRVVDAHGEPIDQLGALSMVEQGPIRGRALNSMKRAPVKLPLDTGIRSINTLLTVGRGQRLGMFASAGVGKSVLVGMMADHTAADVIVVGLIGERGREVREFVEQTLGPSARGRTTVVAAPGNEPALMRIQAANYATAIAEYYRDQGLHVLLVIDSLTRYAMALREVALAVGEVPATRGYPPSVFARMPELIERAGNGLDGSGSITAFYTVLIDGDEAHDPIGEAARSFLDGHIALSRELAQAAHFPAIEIGESVSRVMPAITESSHQQDAQTLRQAWARYHSNRELISIGAYVPGSDPFLDRTIENWPAIQSLLCQPLHESSNAENANGELHQIAERLRADPPQAVEIEPEHSGVAK